MRPPSSAQAKAARSPRPRWNSASGAATASRPGGRPDGLDDARVGERRLDSPARGGPHPAARRHPERPRPPSAPRRRRPGTASPDDHPIQGPQTPVVRAAPNPRAAGRSVRYTRRLVVACRGPDAWPGCRVIPAPAQASEYPVTSSQLSTNMSTTSSRGRLERPSPSRAPRQRSGATPPPPGPRTPTSPDPRYEEPQAPGCDRLGRATVLRRDGSRRSSGPPFVGGRPSLASGDDSLRARGSRSSPGWRSFPDPLPQQLHRAVDPCAAPAGVSAAGRRAGSGARSPDPHAGSLHQEQPRDGDEADEKRATDGRGQALPDSDLVSGRGRRNGQEEGDREGDDDLVGPVATIIPSATRPNGQDRPALRIAKQPRPR